VRTRRGTAGRCLALLIASAGLATDAAAQSAEGLIAGGGAAATAINSGTDVAVFGGVGYRFNRVVGFGIELTFVPSLEPALPDIPEILRPTSQVSCELDANLLTAPPA